MRTRLNFTYKVVINNKMTERCSTHSKRIFIKKLRTINWKLKGIKVTIRVNYGKQSNDYGTALTFSNEGNYYNKKDLWLAFNAFTEK